MKLEEIFDELGIPTEPTLHLLQENHVSLIIFSERS